MVRLTKLVKAAGWAAKVGPGTLGNLLSDLPIYFDERVLVSSYTFDDAGIYKISDDLALVQTVDFFTPIVDSPYDFGKIAVANSLSDVYAMGGVPKTALNVVSFPINCLEHSILKEIMRGGADKLIEAEVALLGGHTVDDLEPKYGVAVTGFIDPKDVWTNGGANVGDVLILTKKLGVGLVTTALKSSKNIVIGDDLIEVTDSMAKLNKKASEIAKEVGEVHGCTDITGFGLIGHLQEMIGSDENISFEIDSAKLKFFNKAIDFAKDGLIPGGGYRNRDYLKDNVEYMVPEFIELAVVAPETSGGLVLAFSEDKAEEFLSKMQEAGELAFVIGRVIARGNKKIFLI